ncbi:MAG: Abi family protein [Tannerellaceae bacterium]|jgi:abortive infection bacteriophage resistance protein|nr:Abi family protein [Tannerellaceae bacterium]
MKKAIYTKPFLSYEEQIALLKSRGMKFSDEAKALHLLHHISYYRFSVYWRPLLADKENVIFKSEADFETAFALYKFDRELRRLLLSELEKIEIAVRSRMVHSISTEHGSFWMEDESLFADSVKHQSTLAKIQEELLRSDEESILSFKSAWNNPLPPSFITLEIASFGALSRLYENLQSDVAKREVSQAFGLSDKVFISWLHSFVYIRNVCAHHARIWNRWLRIQPLFPRHATHPWLTDKSACNNRMYYVLSMILYLLNTVNPGHSFKQKVESLFMKYPNVDRRAMGFPVAWRSETLWEKASEI